MSRRSVRGSKDYPGVNEKPLLVREEAVVYEARSLLLSANMGTFADSKTAPIHGWFHYPAGFSYRAVESILDHHGVRPGHRVYDPFAGTGATGVLCKWRCIESVGVEAQWQRKSRKRSRSCRKGVSKREGRRVMTSWSDSILMT